MKTETAMVMKCVAYKDGISLGDVTIEDISEVLKQPDTFVWLGLREVDVDLLQKIQEEFGLHELSVEDARNAHQRPKIEEYGDSLFITLMESAFNRNLGFDVKDMDNSIRKDAFWFGESQSRVVITVAKEKRQDFVQLLEKAGVNTSFLGNVTSGAINIDNANWGNIIDWKNKYDNAIGNLLAGHESEHALAAL